MIDTRNNLPDMSDAYAKVVEEGKKTDKPKRWQDDDGDGKWYEKSDVDGKISKREKNSRSHDCAKKVKSEEYGIGTPVKGMHDLDENGVVQHYDVFFEHGIEKNVPVSSLEILEGHMHEHVIHEGKKNCGCGQDPCITYGKGKNAHKMPDGTVMAGKTHKEEVAVKESMLLTKADKKGNTPAWQNRDKKNVKTGEPLYKKADHLKKEEAEIETLKKMELFSDYEIQAIVDKMDFSGEE